MLLNRDEEGQALKAAAEDAGKALDIKQLEIRALTLLTTGIFKAQEDKRPKSATRATPEAGGSTGFCVQSLLLPVGA